MKKYLIVAVLFFTACTTSKKLITTNNQYTIENLVNSSILSPAHVGICVYEPATNKYLYNYQSNKYFVPASNVKIFTCYAAMQKLQDSLVGLKYITENDSSYTVQFTADPTLLLQAFSQQPVANFFATHKNIQVVKANFKANKWGNGWAWNDYNDSYMAENSAAPIYGNLVSFNKTQNTLHVLPKFFKDSLTILGNLQKGFVTVNRAINSNSFSIKDGVKKFTTAQVPFITSENLTVTLLEDTLHKTIYYTDAEVDNAKWTNVYSQPTDSMLKIMMHTSDNFFAEQTLLMISNELFGEMNDTKLIDTLLKTDFAAMPQKPKWVDGSGLSRYNLATPQSLVWVLTQIKNKFSWQRISNIFATGNEGTLSNYYKNYTGKIYAKTGTLSNHVALSGFITTNSGRQLVFSVLVNAHQSSATDVRRLVEKFITTVIDNE